MIKSKFIVKSRLYITSLYIKIFIFSLLIFCINLSKADQDIYQLVKIGQTRQEITKLIGSPYLVIHIQKQEGPIWGPEEEFWDKIQKNTKLEVWKYKNDTGHLNLYFIEDNNHLAYKAFAPKGVVYEPVN